MCIYGWPWAESGRVWPLLDPPDAGQPEFVHAFLPDFTLLVGALVAALMCISNQLVLLAQLSQSFQFVQWWSSTPIIIFKKTTRSLALIGGVS
jgi:hypothetical protein